jgi:Rrf2 family transcriptional regulator, iron-sulfur cluster assembly transcription factor
VKLTAHEEYGLRCLLRVGKRRLEGTVTIDEISKAEGISTAYVAKLLRILRRAGFVKSARGNAGGYFLARPATQIIVGEALESLGGRLFATDFCHTHTGQRKICKNSTDCALRPLWQAIQVALDQVLGRTTLQDLLRTEHEMAKWIPTLSAINFVQPAAGPPLAQP